MRPNLKSYLSLIAALLYVLVLLLWGCAAQRHTEMTLLKVMSSPPSAPNDPLGDRPWVTKPTVKQSLIPALRAVQMASRPPYLHPMLPQGTKAVFGAYLEPTQIQGLTVVFEGKTNLLGANWITLTNYPYPMAGGYLYYTNALSNFTALYVRQGYQWPR